MDAVSKPPKNNLTKRSFTLRLAATVLLINLFVITLVVLSLYKSLQYYEERVSENTLNLAHSLETNISTIIGKADIALQAVIDEAERELHGGGIHAPTFNAYIERQRQRMPELDGIRVTNLRGYTVYGTEVDLHHPAYNADRDYFVHASHTAQSGLFVSKPMLGRVAKKWVLNVSRRVNNPDGSFAGVAYAAIAVESINQLFASLNVGQNGSLVLRNLDLGIIARYPEPEGSGNPIGEKQVSKELEALVSSGKLKGLYKTVSPIDSIERYYAFRKFAGYPLYVTAGRAKSDYILAWRRDAQHFLVLTALFSLVTVFSSWLVFLRWRAERLVEDELRQHRDHLESLVMMRTEQLEQRNSRLLEEVYERKRTEDILQEREDELKQTLQMVRRLAQHMETVRENERKRIAREVHDDLGQMLTALRFELHGLRDRLSPDDLISLHKTDDMLTHIADSIQSVQRICADLRPQILDSLGLSEALDWQVQEFSKRTGIPCLFHKDSTALGRLGDTCETVLFRIFQELLTNVARHAEASEVTVTIASRENGCFVEVKDDGKGITESEIASEHAFGLIGMRERVQMCAGELTICGADHQGTTVQLLIPWRNGDENDEAVDD